MTNTTCAELVSDLEATVSSGSPERRVLMLQRVLHLFLSSAARLNETQIGVFDDVMVRLIEHVEAPALVHLSAALAASSSAPQQSGTPSRLSQGHRRCRTCFLLRSSALSDAALTEIASRLGRQHLLTISCRRTIGEALTDILLKTRRPRCLSRACQECGREILRSRLCGDRCRGRTPQGHRGFAGASPGPSRRDASRTALEGDRRGAAGTAQVRAAQIASEHSGKCWMTSQPMSPKKQRSRSSTPRPMPRLPRSAIPQTDGFRYQSFCDAARGHQRHRVAVGAVRCPHRGYRAVDGRRKSLRRPDRGLPRFPAGTGKLRCRSSAAEACRS